LRRVLLVTDVTAPGGVDTYARDLAAFARDAGWSPAVLIDDGPGADRLSAMLRAIGADLTRGPLYHRAHSEDVRAEATAAAIDRAGADLVHAICGAPWNTVVPRETALERGLPLTFTEQYVAPGFVFEPGVRERIAALYRRAAAVVAVSRDNARLLTDEYGLTAGRLVVIPNAVRTDRPRPDAEAIAGMRADLGLPTREVHAVVIARHAPQKGLDVLLRALALLPEADRARLQVTLIGDGPDRAALEALARDVGSADAVAFVGWRDDAARFLPAFDVFLLPSRAEGQPFALAEALAAGVPCIATRVSGIPELLDDGRGGDLVPPESPEAFAAAIGEFLRDPRPLRAKAAHGLAHVRAHHDLGANLGRLVALWDAALAR
jgi:glycosyltransferase involved in cell wall biosynthesis